MLPMNEPLALRTKDVGAGPVSARSQRTNRVRKRRYARNRDGGSGAPVHGLGKLRSMAFAR